MNGQIIVRFFKKELNYSIDPKRPFVGSEFNMTKAVIHADGLLKDESIYNSFDTGKLLTVLRQSRLIKAPVRLV